MSNAERIFQELHEAGITARRNAKCGVTASASAGLAVSHRAARVLIAEYGTEAMSVAVARLKTLILLDDVEGATVWLAVIRAIETLT